MPVGNKLFAAYFTMDFTGSPSAGKGTWCLLPVSSAMLPTATKHFDRAGRQSIFNFNYSLINSLSVDFIL